MEKNYKVNPKSEFFDFDKNIKFILPLIIFGGLLIRFFYVPYNIPITFDAFGGYFLYALDITRLGQLPDYTLTQSGWGEFLAIFFTLFHSENFIDYMNLQRTLSVVVSGITVFPIYLICRKFFNSQYSLIGAVIFAFEPRVIINSTLGISEPLYIFAISLGILFFINSNKKIIYLSFAFLAWATIIRPEGQFWFYAFSIIYFLRFRKNRKDCLMFLICLGVFLLVLSPIVMHRIDCCENDFIFGRILAELWQYENSSTSIDENGKINAYGPNFENGIKLLGWSLIPIFIVLLPLGILKIIKERGFLSGFLIGVPLILFIPVFYSVSIAPDTRYVYPLFPIFCVIALFGIKWISRNSYNKKITFVLFFIVITVSSLVFLEYKKIDYTNDLEAFQITQLIDNQVVGMNANTEIVGFSRVSQFSDVWSVTKMDTNWHEWNDKKYKSKFIPINENTIEEFIVNSEKKKLSHIIIDDSENIPKFLKDIKNNEEKYPYLIKIFDSNELDFKYQVIMYKIDYEVLKNLSK